MTKKFFTNLGYTSLWAALCAYSLSLLTLVIGFNIHISLTNPLLLFIFGSTLFIYNAHNFYKLNTLTTSSRNQWNAQHKKWIIIYGCLGLLLLTYNSFYLHFSSVLLLILLAGITIAYTYPILFYHSHRVSLKHFGIIKPITLSLVWVSVTFLLPVIEYAMPINQELVFKGVIRWFFILILCIIFDIKDIKIDSNKNIKTIPILLRENIFSTLQMACNIIIVLLLIGYIFFHYHTYYLIQILSIFILKTIILQLKKDRSELYYVIHVDGMMLLYSVLLIITVITQ
jgi:4-hydroxybenzoate polyprenyltransferase